MATFTVEHVGNDVVTADLPTVWAVMTDPQVIADLTPLVDCITAEGDRWTWELVGISALGVSIKPRFTERMVFDEPHRITFAHDPATGRRETAGVEGVYDLEEVEGGTRLRIRMAVSVELPLPRLAGGAVRGVMKASMQQSGNRFWANLLRHLERAGAGA